MLFLSPARGKCCAPRSEMCGPRWMERFVVEPPARFVGDMAYDSNALVARQLVKAGAN
jgi:hypothetical protein